MNTPPSRTGHYQCRLVERNKSLLRLVVPKWVTFDHRNYLWTIGGRKFYVFTPPLHLLEWRGVKR
jgi:hypothetical protein